MTTLLIDSGGKKIEAIYNRSSKQNAPLVLLMHPHPLYGGNMNSKVLFYIEKVFFKHGFTTLRFNFRGVGKSEGKYDNGNGELMDASVCLDWLQENNPYSNTIFVVGFSFGAYIALQLMVRRIEVDYFIAVSTPTNMFDISFIHPCTTDGVFIHAEKDEISSLKDLEKNLKKIQKSKSRNISLEVIKDANHFFEEKLSKLQFVINNYITKYLNSINKNT